jgi:preprotein translocase SecF subunit
MRFFHDTNIDFIKSRFFFFIVSLSSLIGAIALTLIVGVKFGIDFVGGAEVQYQFAKHVETDQIRKVIDGSHISGAEIKSYGKEGQFIVRVKEAEHVNGKQVKISDEVTSVLDKGFPGNKVTKLGENTIGPKVGKEMRTQAVVAVVLSILAIMLYVAFRFEFIYGLGSIIALVHDVIFTFGFTLLMGDLGLINVEFNQSMLAALLTVIGYSINDTVIIFDRIRENKEKHKGISLRKLINLSINETLSRTINTVMTVVLVLTTMVIFAGPVLQGFSFTMLVGIVAGTYSSIYIAGSFVIWYSEKYGKGHIHEMEMVNKGI